MPAAFVCAPPIRISFPSVFPDFEVSYEGKRVYFWEDMRAIAAEVGWCGIYELRPTTFDSWLKRSGVAPRKPRTRAYTKDELVCFCLFCLCRASYSKRTHADALYDQLT